MDRNRLSLSVPTERLICLRKDRGVQQVTLNWLARGVFERFWLEIMLQEQLLQEQLLPEHEQSGVIL